VIGRRRIDTHLLALQSLGAKIDAGRDGYRLTTHRLHGADILLDEMSVTATENVLLAAVLAEGRSTIRNAASEPHVQDLCALLSAMGARIVGAARTIWRSRASSACTAPTSPSAPTISRSAASSASPSSPAARCASPTVVRTSTA
jgi:UDP-N-acetylglucosamine 1-carboxyvinyltransferase